VVLKSIELFGFKSFADKSRIEFTEGISALLGPNGCGKSNVVDAIKWVLGEQATKSLRADKMEDVIFNGTETRKALNVAEVAMVLSNESGILPLDVSEISIKRRLYRSGESEYFVNNTPARLKDIREIFFDTGIGKSAYSIMEQGKIDQILSNKPEERRHIFEEAAGITKYKVRGAEAERKLEKTQENMVQVDNILKEVRRSYETLRIQSEKTIRYRELKDQIFVLEMEIQLLKLKDFREERNRKERLLKKKTAERDSLRNSIDSINETLEQNLDIVNTMESKLIDTQKKLYGIDLEKNGLERQMVLLQERSREIERQVESNKAREKSFKDKLQILERQWQDKKDASSEMEKSLEEVERNIIDFNRNIEQAVSRIRENEASIVANEQKVKSLEQQQAALQDDLRLITDDIVRELDKGLKDTGYSHEERQKLEKGIKKEINSLSILLTGRNSAVQDVRKLDHLTKEVIKTSLDTAAEGLEQAAAAILSVKEKFSKFAATIPAFLDDFLAPRGIITRKREIDATIADVRQNINGCRTTADSLRKEIRQLSQKIEDYRKTLEELKLSRERYKTQLTSLSDTLRSIEGEIGEIKNQIAENAREIKACSFRLSELRKEEEEYRGNQVKLESREKHLKEELGKLESGISKRNKDLIDKEKKVKSSMADLTRIQTDVEKIQITLASLDTEIKNTHENFRDKHSRDLMEFEARMYEIQKPVQAIRDDLNKSRDEQRSLGQVNLMAPEEFAEVKERFDFLTNQINDLSKARDDLKHITQEITVESTELFLDTYDKIRRNFHSMFRRLFGGGRAELRLCEPDDVLNSGIEIFAQPPGKRLENIALLSGGERSLTAVALLFATYMVKPSPFCVLDEIDAALDEENIGRFINILSEFGKSSQFIIITHNKKTVASAKTLLGVTMAESGVSQVISVRIESPAMQV